jgi:secreted trypsin-like serine protease
MHESHENKNYLVLHISTQKVFIFSSGAPPSLLTAGGRVVNGTDADVGQYPFIVSSLHPASVKCMFKFNRSN